MKKLIILIFAALFVFSACKKPPEAQSPAQSEIENSGESLHIELTNPNIGVDDGIYYSAKRGCYTFDGNGVENNIFYIDYETKTKVYLCERPECTHNSEECTSWFRATSSSQLFANAEDTRLFLLNEGGYVNATEDEQYAQITSMSASGSDKKLLCRLNSNEMFEKATAKDNENIYAIISIADTEQVFSRKGLREINMQTGEQTTILKLDSMNESIIGAYDDFIVTSDIVEDKMRFYTINVKSGEREYTGYEHDIFQNLGKVLFYNEKIYYLKEAAPFKVDICAYNLLDKTQTTQYSGLDIIMQEFTSIIGVYDNRLIIYDFDNTDLDNTKQRLLNFNLQNNELIENTISYRYYSNTRMSSICSQGNEFFMVKSNYKDDDYESVMISNDGTPYTVRGSGYEYSLIKKQDYWNNNPEYIEIEEQ